MSKTPTIYWIDLFCGAGGTTTGIHLSNANARVIACVNHDAEAIKTHYTNHPECVHFNEDVRNWSVIFRLLEIVKELRKQEPDCIINIWASLECTHFSKAKGGLARDADSRTLAEHLYYYIKLLCPDYLFIENVNEFLTWGPVDENGKPIPELKGVDYDRWVHSIKMLGYQYDYESLNAADFGAYTSRERYFGVFAKRGLPITFPKPTHARREKATKTGLTPWKPVKEVLDFDLQGKSIFGLTSQGKLYSDNTLERVYAGCVKYIQNGEFGYMKKYYSGRPKGKVTSLEDPMGTITCSNQPRLVRPVFLTSYYGNGNAHSVNYPCNTLTTKDRYAAHFLHGDYGNPVHSSMNEPAGSIPTNSKHNLISAWLMDNQFKNKGRSTEQPCQTLIARMDKAPLHLVSTQSGRIDQSIDQPGDTHIRTQIRAFMRQYGITDITIRMLTIPELKAIQGFPEDYILTGTKTNQLKFIGNSVVPLMAQKLVEANYQSILKHLIAA